MDWVASMVRSEQGVGKSTSLVLRSQSNAAKAFSLPCNSLCSVFLFRPQVSRSCATFLKQPGARHVSSSFWRLRLLRVYRQRDQEQPFVSAAVASFQALQLIPDCLLA